MCQQKQDYDFTFQLYYLNFAYLSPNQLRNLCLLFCRHLRKSQCELIDSGKQTHY